MFLLTYKQCNYKCRYAAHMKSSSLPWLRNRRRSWRPGWRCSLGPQPVSSPWWNSGCWTRGNWASCQTWRQKEEMNYVIFPNVGLRFLSLIWEGGLFGCLAERLLVIQESRNWGRISFDHLTICNGLRCAFSSTPAKLVLTDTRFSQWKTAKSEQSRAEVSWGESVSVMIHRRVTAGSV